MVCAIKFDAYTRGDLGGGANHEIVPLKQGVWGAQLPRSYREFSFA